MQYGFIHENTTRLYWEVNGSGAHKVKDTPHPVLHETMKTHAASCAGILDSDGTVVSLPLGAIQHKISIFANTKEKDMFQKHKQHLTKSPDQRKKAYAAFCICRALRFFDINNLSDTLKSLRKKSEIVARSPLALICAQTN